MKRNKDSAGFTLLEVMVALAILSVGLVSLFQLFSGSLRSAKVSADYTKAVIGAQKKMDEILGCLYVEDFEKMHRAGDFGTEEGENLLEGYRWEFTDEDYPVPELEEEWSEKHNLEEKKILLKKIIMRVTWQSRRNNKKLELVTLKMLYKKNE